MVRGSEFMWTVLTPSKVKCFRGRPCLLQLVRSCHHEADDVNSDHSELERDLCAAWVSGHAGVS